MNTLPNPLHGEWVDSMADWSVTHQPLTERDLDRFIAERIATPACSTCAGPCLTPQACQQPDPDPSPFVFPLEPILTRHQWLGPTLLALICFVWLCIDGYLENLP